MDGGFVTGEDEVDDGVGIATSWLLVGSPFDLSSMLVLGDR